MTVNWVTEELASLELGDKRRERRAGMIVNQLAQVCKSQPEAAKSKAALKANYRFMQHPEFCRVCQDRRNDAIQRDPGDGERRHTRIDLHRPKA